MMWHRLTEDRGLTLTELMVAMFISAIVTAGAVTWAVTVNRADERNRETVRIVDELRWAKTELVNELRFADEVFPPSSGDDEISMFIDGNANEALDPGVGELVTYRILANGILQRFTDDPADPTSVMANHLLPAASSILIVDTDKVEINFVVDTDLGDNVNQRTIRTSVKVRGS